MSPEEKQAIVTTQAGVDAEGQQSEPLPSAKILSFHCGAGKRPGKSASILSELMDLLKTYDRLIALLRETDDAGLDLITDNMVMLVVRCRETLGDTYTDAMILAMRNELAAGLREMPRTLRALLPGLGPRLCESLEHKLGIQFSVF